MALWTGSLTAQKVTPVADTSNIIVLKEVVYSGVVPLTNKMVTNFYSSSSINTIDELLSRVDGLSMIKRGAYALEPQVGGFSAGQINVTIDGMKIFGACTDKMDPVTSYLEPINLKSIEVSQGVSASSEGCTVGGGVQLSLCQPGLEEMEKKAIRFEAGYQTNSSGKHFSLSSGFAKNKWSGFYSGVYRKYGCYADGSGNIVPYSQYSKANLYASLKHNLGKDSWVKSDLVFDNGLNIGYPALPMDVKLARAVIASLEYKGQYARQITAKIYFNDIRHIMDDSHRDSLYQIKNLQGDELDTVIMRMDMPGRSTTMGTIVKRDWMMGDNNILSARFDSYINLAYADMTMYMHFLGLPPEAPMFMQTWPSMLRSVSGSFLQWKHIFSAKYILYCQGRIDYGLDYQRNNMAKEEFSVQGYSLPRSMDTWLKNIGSTVKMVVSPRLNMELSMGLGERLPTITERYGYYLYNAYDGYDYVGNPYLQTEKSLNGTWKVLFNTPKVHIGLTNNVNFLRNYILGKHDTSLRQLNFYAQGLRVFMNYPDAMIYSASLQTFVHPLKDLIFFTSLKYVYGQIGQREKMPLVPPLGGVIAVVWQRPTYSAQIENLFSANQSNINADYGERHTPSFWIVNLRVSYHLQITKSDIEVAAGVSNLFNKVYTEHLDWGRINRPGRGIEVVVRLKI